MSNPVYVLLGLFVLWWSWLGFNTGSAYGLADSKWEAAARAGAGTIVATMAAGMTSIIFSLIKHKGKVDVYGVTAGIVSSLGKIFIQIANLININNLKNNSRNQLRLLHVFDLLFSDNWIGCCPSLSFSWTID